MLAQPSDTATAVYLQAQLRAVGVQMDIQSMDRPTVRARARAGTFDALLVEVNTSRADLAGWFGKPLRSSTDSPAVNDLLLKAQDTVDPDAIDQIYRTLAPVDWCRRTSNVPLPACSER